MNALAPWTESGWPTRADPIAVAALRAAGRPPIGPIETVKSWGRSCVRTVPTEGGPLWIKHAYRLPPGEERVLSALARRHLGRVPDVVATWSGAVAMEPLPGRELDPGDPADAWVSAARTLAEIAAGEREFVTEWEALGLRDRRPPAWASALDDLFASPVVHALDADVRSRFEAFRPEFEARYIAAFTSPATLVHQDSGCCNIHMTDAGPILFDWSDVVIGHPVFSCDRLLDQTPRAMYDAVIEAFLEPLALPRSEFDAMRRSNVLHEVLRYHDELAHLAPDDPSHRSLAEAVRSQIRVLVDFESKRR